MKRLVWQAHAFFTVPISPVPLGVFRLMVAAFVLIQAMIWYPDWTGFLGNDGWIQWEISKALTQSWSIHIQDLYQLLHWLFNFTELQSVWTLYVAYIASATGLLLGWHTRFFAIATWLCHYIIVSTIPTFIYGVDIFLHIALFYLMVMPVNKAFSVDLLQGRATTLPTWQTTIALRILQIHLCLVYFSSGYEKALVAQWWSGDVLWRALVQPDFRQYNFDWLATYPVICKTLSWFTIITETLYSIAVWIPRVRVFWISAIVLLHLGIGMLLGLWLFALMMIVLSLSAFGYSVYLDVDKRISQRSEFTMPPFLANTLRI